MPIAAVMTVPVEMYDASLAVASLGGYFWDDIGPKLNCGEAEAFYALLVAWRQTTDADVLMRSHARQDDCGDDHKVDDTNSCGWSYNDDKEE